MGGNRCNHNPANPQLSPSHPIRKGKGGLPRILSLAAERAKAWYKHPQKCTALCSKSTRKTRSERREAYQVVIETVLIHLDLASLCLGTPTLDNGFIDVDMKTIVKTSGIGQRRCERAIAQLKKAGLMEVKQPRKLNAQGDYVGCRSIRIITTTFFEWLGLGPMLQRERARASDVLRRKAIKANRKLSDLMGSSSSGLNAAELPEASEGSKRKTVCPWDLRQPEVKAQFSPLISSTIEEPGQASRVGKIRPTPLPDLVGAKTKICSGPLCRR